MSQFCLDFARQRGPIQTLTMNKVLTPVLALAAIGGAVFSFSQWNARAAAEAALAESNAKIASMESSLASALAAAAKAKGDLDTELANVARLKTERDEANERAKQVAATPGAAPAADAKPQLDLRNIMSNLAKGFDDPEQRKGMKSMQERMVGGAYEKLFAELGLNEADSKLLTEILGERNFLAMDRGRKILSGKTDDASVAEIRKEIAATKTEYDNKAKAVLGEEKFSKLTTYEQTLGDRRGLDSMARDFEKKGQPLDDSQKEKLATIMREERMKSPSNDIPDLGGGPGMAMLMSDAEAKAQQQEEEAYQQRVAARAQQAGLSPDQITVLQESQKRQNERKTFGRVMGRAFLMPPAAK